MRILAIAIIGVFLSSSAFGQRQLTDFRYGKYDFPEDRIENEFTVLSDNEILISSRLHGSSSGSSFSVKHLNLTSKELTKVMIFDSVSAIGPIKVENNLVTLKDSLGYNYLTEVDDNGLVKVLSRNKDLAEYIQPTIDSNLKSFDVEIGNIRLMSNRYIGGVLLNAKSVSDSLWHSIYLPSSLTYNYSPVEILTTFESQNVIGLKVKINEKFWFVVFNKGTENDTPKFRAFLKIALYDKSFSYLCSEYEASSLSNSKLYKLDTTNYSVAEYLELKNQVQITEDIQNDVISLEVGQKNINIQGPMFQYFLRDYKTNRDTSFIKESLNSSVYFFTNDSIVTYDPKFKEKWYSNLGKEKLKILGRNKSEILLYSEVDNRFYETDFSGMDKFDILQNIFEDQLLIQTPREMLIWHRNELKQLYRFTANQVLLTHVEIGEGDYYFLIKDSNKGLIKINKIAPYKSLIEVGEITANCNYCQVEQYTNGYFLIDDGEESQELYEINKDVFRKVDKFWNFNLVDFWKANDGRLFVESKSQDGFSFIYSDEKPLQAKFKFETEFLDLFRKNNSTIEWKRETFVNIGYELNEPKFLVWDLEKGNLSAIPFEIVQFEVANQPKTERIFLGKDKSGETYFYQINSDGIFKLNDAPISPQCATYKDGEVYVLGKIKGGSTQVFVMDVSEGKKLNLELDPIAQNLLLLPIVNELNQPIIAFPNPFTKGFDLKFPDEVSLEQVSIFNSRGILVFELKNGLSYQKKEIARILSNSLISKPLGIYTIRFTTGEKSESLRVVKY